MLNLFGRPMLTGALGSRIDLPPTGWRLLAALSAGPVDGVPRVELVDLLFSRGTLGTLRKLVFDVRKATEGLGLDLLEVDRDVLRLSRGITCDVRHLRSARTRPPLWKIYKGIFFDSSILFKHQPWTSWLSEQREELHDLYVARASAVLNAPEVDFGSKVVEARHLLDHAPDHEGAARILMVEGARTGDAGEVRRRYHDLHIKLAENSAQPDRRTTDVFHRLVGLSQRRLEPTQVSPEINLPTIYIASPVAETLSGPVRLIRSFLVDLTIGLHRASLFRVVASRSSDASSSLVSRGDAGERARTYELVTTVLDHVLGRKIAFTLLHLPTREVLWTDKIDATKKFTVDAYNLVVAGVLSSLIQRIKDIEIAAFRLAADPDAYALFLAGASSLSSLDLVRLRRGRMHLRRSLAQSQGFSPTTSALAQSYSLEWLITGRGEHALLATAREHALHAIESDPYEARGFKALGFCDLFEKRYDNALENYDIAEQLNRNYPELIMDHACCLLHCGDIDGSLSKLEISSRLSADIGDVFYWTKASALFLKGVYSEALDTMLLMKDRDPIMRLLAATHAQLGNVEEARICRIKAMQIYPAMTIAGWTSTVALRDPAHIRHYAEGLAKAGFA